MQLESLLCVAVGKRGSGKSSAFREIADRYKNRPCLILDAGGAKAYRDIPTIPLNSMHYLNEPNKLGNNVYKIPSMGNLGDCFLMAFGFRYDGKKWVYHENLCLQNIALFAEDARTYIDRNPSRNVEQCLKAIKQRNIFLYLSYHSLSEIPPAIIKLNPDALLLKKTQDKPIFRNIPNTVSLSARRKIEKAYYKTKFYGLTQEEILDELTDKELETIVDHLRLNPTVGKGARRRSDLSRALMKFASGKTRLSAEEKAQKRYYTESVLLYE
ncbi:MAG: hypothetical protein AAFW00_19775 [Bacteroidota bacterium]